MVRSILLAVALFSLSACQRDANQPIAPPLPAGEVTELPAPRLDNPAPLMKALAERHSTREFRDTELTDQQLSDLLWAAFGENRDEGGRTAPSAYGNSEIDVYLTLAKGAYRYDAAAHQLVLAAPEDLRALTGEQGFVANAALNLVYVADFERMNRIGEEDKPRTAAADAGFIGQNVYLFCAAEGLATVFRGYIDKPALHQALGLRATQEVLFAQTVGHASGG